MSEASGGGEIERERLEVEGRLDGVRTRRRLFYFDGARETYEGGFEEDLAETVKQFIDKPAVATLERVRKRRKTGVVGRWSYRLLYLRAPGNPPPSLDDLPLDGAG